MPPKGKRPGGGEDAFLFVNEDFSTLFGGAKNADLDRSKQSHVQRQSFARRRKSRKGGLESSGTSPAASEDAQSPISSSRRVSVRTQSSSQQPLLPLPTSTSLWLPLGPDDENTSNTISQTRPLSSYDGVQMPRWRTPAGQFSQYNSYPLTLPEEALSDATMAEPRLGSPHAVAPRPAAEMLGDSEEMFSLSPVPPQPPNDPFSNIQLALEKWAPPLMRHFTLNMTPEFFYADLRATSLHSMRHVDHLHEDMRSCMANPAEMYALLAASSSDAMKRDGKLILPDLASEDSDRVPLLFKSKAFEALRVRLASGELSQRIVIAILRMVHAALYTSNFSAVEAHYRAALSMIQAIGGLEMFNDFEKERLIMHDFFLALTTGSPPRLELSWDPGDSVTAINFDLVIRINRPNSMDAGRRIRAIAENSEVALHPVVAQCIPELTDTQQVLEWLRGGPYQPAEYRWLSHRRLAIIHRLLNVDANASTSLLEVVRFAVICYCVIVRAFSYNVHGLICQYVEPELRKWEVNALVDAFGTCADLALWVAVIFGIGISKQMDHEPPQIESPQHASPPQAGSRSQSRDIQEPDITTFVARTGRRACRRLGITTESQLRGTMKTFLFDDDFVDNGYLTFVKDDLQLAD